MNIMHVCEDLNKCFSFFLFVEANVYLFVCIYAFRLMYLYEEYVEYVSIFLFKNNVHKKKVLYKSKKKAKNKYTYIRSVDCFEIWHVFFSISET